MRRLTLPLVIAVLLIAFGSFGARTLPEPDPPTPKRFRESNWPQFSTRIDDRATFASPITPQNVDQLRVNWAVSLPEGVDSTPLYATNVMTEDGVHDMVIVETMIGRVVAYDAHDGEMLWHTEPPGGPRWTTSAPAIDPRGQFVFAYCLDGFIHRYALQSGEEITGDGWPVLLTRKGEFEKGSSNIIIATARDQHTYLYMAIAAYPEPGDEGDYQGHVVIVDIDSGAKRVFNALCSDRDMIFDEGQGANDCSQVQAGIWARAAAVYDTVTDRVFVTTGNGTYDADRGGFNWGSSVVALRPDGSTDGGTPLDAYTPVDYQTINDVDADLSSTTIATLPTPRNARLPRLGVQSGKDGLLRLLNLEDMSGMGGPRNLGGELQLIPVPQGGGVFTQPATSFSISRGRAQLYISNRRGVSAMQLVPSPEPHLETMWMTHDVKGTSPVLANGLLFVAGSGAIMALDPSTGTLRWGDTSIGDVHWQSPIIVNGQLFLCDQAAKLYAYTLQ
jgi:outer membrane protein assembly factor BamB